MTKRDKFDKSMVIWGAIFEQGLAESVLRVKKGV
jgi:hypothetical protein